MILVCKINLTKNINKIIQVHKITINTILVQPVLKQSKKKKKKNNINAFKIDVNLYLICIHKLTCSGQTCHLVKIRIMLYFKSKR